MGETGCDIWEKRGSLVPATLSPRRGESARSGPVKRIKLLRYGEKGCARYGRNGLSGWRNRIWAPLPRPQRAGGLRAVRETRARRRRVPPSRRRLRRLRALRRLHTRLRTPRRPAIQPPPAVEPPPAAPAAAARGWWPCRPWRWMRSVARLERCSRAPCSTHAPPRDTPTRGGAFASWEKKCAPSTHLKQMFLLEAPRNSLERNSEQVKCRVKSD